MRKLILLTMLVLAASLLACFWADRSVEDFTLRARHLRTEAAEAIAEGGVQRAEVVMVELASHMKRHKTMLEILCEHEDLHQLKGNLIDAQASIEFGIEDDFYQAIYRFGEILDHLADTHRFSLSHIL